MHHWLQTQTLQGIKNGGGGSVGLFKLRLGFLCSIILIVRPIPASEMTDAGIQYSEADCIVCRE